MCPNTRDEIPWTVPFQRNPNFSGRQREIKILENLITFSDQFGTRDLAITGLKGIGKTQLAIELAYRMRDRNIKSQIIWITCTNTESTKERYSKNASALEIPRSSPKDDGEYFEPYFSEDTQDSLLILHNVNDWDVWKAFKDILPQERRRYRILATTHNQQIATEIASSRVVVLGELDEESAVGLLYNELENKALLKDRSTTTALLDQLAYLPLAITQAAVYLNENPALLLSEYLHSIGRKESEAIGFPSNNFRGDCDQIDMADAINTTWFDSFSQLQAINPSAADYLKVMACVDSQDIPIAILPPLHDLLEASKARELLQNFHFLDKRTTVDSLFRLHPIVRMAARSWMRQSHEFEKYQQKVVARLEELLPDSCDDNRELWRQYLPHVMFVLKGRLVQVGTEYNDLPWKTAHYLWNNGRFKEAQTISIDFMIQRREKYGDQDHSTLAYMSWVAYTFSELWQWQMARELEMHVFAARKQLLGIEHTDTISSMAHLARIYAAEGQWSRAEEMHLQLMDISKQQSHTDNLIVLELLSEVATTFRMFRKRKEELAIRLYAFKAHEHLEGYHPDTMAKNHEMALAHYAYSSAGMENAKEIFGRIIEMWRGGQTNDRSARAIDEQTFGPNHAVAMASIECLARIHEDQRDWDKAEKVQTTAIESYREVLGSQHPYTLNAISQLARIYQRQDRWDEAGALLSEIVEASRSDQFLNYPSIWQNMFDLADIYEQQGRQEEAERMKQQAIKIKPSGHVLGPTYSHFLARMQSLSFAAPEEEVNACKLMAQVGQLVAKRPVSLYDHSGQIAADMLVKWGTGTHVNSSRHQFTLKLFLDKAGKLARTLKLLAGRK